MKFLLVKLRKCEDNKLKGEQLNEKFVCTGDNKLTNKILFLLLLIFCLLWLQPIMYSRSTFLLQILWQSDI